MTDPSRLDRRAFLGVIGASFLAACTDATDEPTAGDAPETTPSSLTPSSDPSPTETPSTTEPIIEPIEAPALDLRADAFALGVASGEPDHETVVLWTRVVGDGLPDQFEVVWEVAADDTFDTLVATDLSSAGADDGYSLHVVAHGLQPDTVYWYRFRAGAVTSPTGRTRTMPATGSRRHITLGVSSCQSRSGGAWAAHGDIAATDIDIMLWLGDFIYGDDTTLDEYRADYADTIADPLLKSARAAHPWVVFADDHEVANDYDAGIDPNRRAAAYRAWWEHQPTRLPRPGADGRADLGRSLLLGDVQVIGLDTRQFADESSLLGSEQWSRLEESIEQAARSQADGTIRHVLIASPVIMSGLRDLEGLPLVPYSIDAYPAERERMASLLAEVDSPIIVSGDLHTSLVADFSSDPLDGAATPVAIEIMAPAISSAFPERFAPLAPFLPLINPQLREIDVQNGWLRLQWSDRGPTAEFRFVDDVSDPASLITVRPITL